MNKPQEKPQQINEQQVQALLQSLQNQRNAALNGLAQLEANLAMAQTRIQELEKELSAAQTAALNSAAELSKLTLAQAAAA